MEFHCVISFLSIYGILLVSIPIQSISQRTVYASTITVIQKAMHYLHKTQYTSYALYTRPNMSIQPGKNTLTEVKTLLTNRHFQNPHLHVEKNAEKNKIK